MNSRELRKQAKATFTRRMAEIGFKLGPTAFYYYREREWIKDVIWISPKAGGRSLGAYVQAWVPEMTPEYDVSLFPEKFSSTCSGLAAGDALGKLGVMPGPGGWTLERYGDNSHIFEELYQVIIKHALPWFDSITNAEQLIEKLNPQNLHYDELKKSIDTTYSSRPIKVEDS